jgi:hypothetical protein
VREAFRRRGHDAISCDLAPAEDDSPYHLLGDVLPVAYGSPIRGSQWDLMIAHPPCRYLSRAGARFTHEPGREEKRAEAMQFFLALANAPVPRRCIENPEGYPRHAYRAPDQVINPHEFGHQERKKTLLWLINLPPLFASLICVPEESRFVDRGGKARYFTDAPSGCRDRSVMRARTFTGIAEAMANQWGSL